MSQAPDDGATSARSEWALLGGGLALSLTIYLLRLDRVVGLFVDDAWYALLAKSLATGQGYQLINSPTPGILPLYPPAFPFLLSFVFRFFPDFPQNITLLKMVSIAAMMGVGALSFVYYRRHRGVSPKMAVGIAVCVVLCQPLVSMATSTLMSECFFAFVLIAQLTATASFQRRLSEGERGAWVYLLLSGFFAAVAFLTRSIAIGLIAGVFLFFLKEKLFRVATIFVALVVLFAGPWTLYSASHSPTTEQKLEQGGHIVLPYQEQFWQREAGVSGSGRIAAKDLPARVLKNLMTMAGQDFARMLVPPYFKLISGSVKRTSLTEPPNPFDPAWLATIPFFLISLMGFFLAAREKITFVEMVVPLMLAVILLWPWETIRFLLPLAPFVFYYFFRGIEKFLQLIPRPTNNRFLEKGILVAALSIFLISLVEHANYISEYHFSSAIDRSKWLIAFDDTEKLMEWVKRNVPPSETIITENPPLVYLYTGRRTISNDIMQTRWEIYRKLNARHLILQNYLGNPTPQLLRNYRVVYRANNEQDYRIIDLGPVESRPSLE